MSTTPTPPNGMVSNTELILRKILGEDVTPLLPNSRVEFYLTQVKEYIERLATGATRPIGETTTPLTDGATTNPIMIDGESYTAQVNDLAFYQNKEFLFTANGWREVGDITNLNADMIDDSNTTNKFATAAELEQIQTNKNNISFLTANGGGKNKYSVDATVTGNSHVDATKTSTGYQLSANGSWAHMDQEVVLPSAGRYVISMTISNYNSVASSYAPSIIICPTSSISAPYLGSIIIEGNGEIVLTVETTNPVLYISYYINRSASDSPTSSFEASNVMVCSESDWLISHDYQPYALSNAELTAAIQAIQAQLANQ